MFLPLGDTPNPGGRPLVNYFLIGTNIAVFLLISLPLTLQRPDLSSPLLIEYLRAVGAEGRIPVDEILRHVSAYDLFVFQYGFRAAEPSMATLFAAMFLHGGWLHLAGNMLFLWIYGDNVEHRLGRVGYLLAYLGTGVAATLFFALFVPDSQMPMIGASGAISGVLGCYFLWFPHNKVKTFIFFFPFVMSTFLIPARLVLGIYLVLDNLLPFLVDGGGGGGVAHGAHIGGFVGGLVLAWGITLGSRAVPEEKRLESPAQRVTRSLQANNVGQATLFYLPLSDPDRRRVPTPDLLAIGEYLLDRRDYHGALTVFRRIVGERPNDPFLDRAYLGAGLAARAIPRNAASARQYFLAAIDVARSDELAEAARGYLRAME